MKYYLAVLAPTVLAAALALPLAAQNTVPVQLKTQLDTRVAKAGDPVTAVTTANFKMDGKTVLPKGSKLTGHIVEVTAAPDAKAPATLVVAFTQAVTPKNQTVKLHGGIEDPSVPNDSGELDGAQEINVTVVPTPDGATRIETQKGNLKLTDGQEVEVVINQVAGE